MSLHHESLYTKTPSSIAAASIFVANKIYEQMMVLSQQAKGLAPSIKPGQVLSERYLLETLSQAPDSISDMLNLSKRLLQLAQNFETELPGLKHLQSIYLPKLEELVAKRSA